MKNSILKVIVFAVFSAATAFTHLAHADTEISYGANDAAGNSVEVNGISIYYETYGEGEPLILLHGNDSNISTFTNQIPAFSKDYQVIAIDSRFHGKSTDVDGVPLTYELLAQDVVGVLDALGHDSAAVVGFSDGGNIGLAMAISHPDRINKLVAIGSNFSPDSTAIYSGILDVITGALASDGLPDRNRKLFKLLAEHPNFSKDDLAAIDTPTLIVAGDHDLIREEHTVELYLQIPTAYLFILPGTTHFPLTEKPDLLNSVTLDFLKSPYKRYRPFLFS